MRGGSRAGNWDAARKTNRAHKLLAAQLLALALTRQAARSSAGGGGG